VNRFVLILIALLTSACASTGAVPRPFPMPGSPPPGPPGSPTPTAEPAPTASARAFDGYALVGTALSLRGVPYRNGGSDPSGFDCSGFTQYVFAQYGIALPREVRDQFQKGKSIQPQDVVPGDLIFFSTVAPGASHVGIAIGSDEFIHAPSSTGVVRIERLGSSYWAPRFVAAKRVS
jgi:cell wall-associated NlpC family hydrolase